MRMSGMKRVKKISSDKWEIFYKIPSEIFHKELDNKFLFEKETGKIYRKFSKGSLRDTTFFSSRRNCICLYVDGLLHSRANLNWFFFTKTWPARKLHHKNGDNLDDRFENLEVK